MPEFEMHFEVTGLKLSIKGSRKDIPLATNKIGTAFAQMLKPAVEIVEGSPVQAQMASSVEHAESSRAVTSKSRSMGKNSKPANAKPLEWRPDPSKWGFPIQDWTSFDKALWLLNAYQSEHADGMTADQIAATFNEHARSAGTIHASNVRREMGKGQQKLLVEKVGSRWKVLEGGTRHASEHLARAALNRGSVDAGA